MSNAVYCTRCGGLLYGNSEMTSPQKCMCPPQVEFVQYGWVCPRCGTVHAPFVSVCGCPAYTISSTIYGLGPINIKTHETLALTPLYKCIDLMGKCDDGENHKLSSYMSNRLITVCKAAEATFNKTPIFYETATAKQLYKIRNFGKKSCDEFLELRDIFKIDH